MMDQASKRQGKKRIGYGTFIVLLCVIVVALTVAGNFLMSALESRYNLKADLSQFQIYSLSEESKNVLDSLDQPIEIYSLYTPSSEDTLTKELLEKYDAYSTNISYKNVNPLTNPSFAQAFDPDQKGIPTNAIIITDQTRQHYKVLTQNQLYVIDAGTNSVLGTMAENYITSAVNYIQTGVVKSVKVMIGHSEMPPQSYLTVLNALSSRGYEMESYNTMTAKAPLDSQNDTLVIVNPRSDLEDDEFADIMGFLSNGGKMLLIMQNVITDEQTGQIQLITDDFPNFSSLLLAYDLSINKDIVIAQDAAHYYNQTSNVIPLVAQHEITMPVLRAGGNVVLNAGSSINVPKVPGGDVTVTPLLVSDETSFSKPVEGLATLEKATGDAEGRYVLAALAERGETKIALFTSASFFTDATIQTGQNYDMALNTLSYLGEQKNSITIMPKQLRGDVLDIKNQSQKDLLSVIVIGVLPAVMIITGIIVWRRRKRL